MDTAGEAFGVKVDAWVSYGPSPVIMADLSSWLQVRQSPSLYSVEVCGLSDGCQSIVIFRHEKKFGR
jgi:hypothetical protein